MSTYPTFRDGKRSIDFILVFKVSAIVTQETEKKHKTFLNSLEKLGLELETEDSTADENVVFVKLHGPDSLIKSYAGLFDIDLACETFEYRPYVAPPAEWLSTPLTRPNINDPIYARAKESIGGEIPKQVTSAERIMVVHQILARSVFGEGRSDYGIKRLIESKVFVDAFPLHDGQHTWTVDGPLNDRQLLALYWGTARCWYKKQPLNLIEKYYGTEIAMYFAWLGMYIKLLFPAAAISVLVMLYGLFTYFTPLNDHSPVVCQSDRVMCPRCHYSKCPREYLSHSCMMAKLTYFFDNRCAVIFSAVMSIWATVFMEMWQREESVLRLQWNLKYLEYTVSLRPEFIERATNTRYSSITGRMEPYIPRCETVCRYTISLVSIGLLLFIMILATFGIMVYRVTVDVLLARKAQYDLITNHTNRRLIAVMSGSLLSSIFILVFQYFYEGFAITLNNLETHRTWDQFSNGYVYKIYALGFTNNYAAAFYISMFKGKFFTHPGDLQQYSFLGGINTDLCDPTGCIVDLAILLVIILICKAFMSNLTQVFIPIFKKKIKQLCAKVKAKEIPQWEDEFYMTETAEFFIVREYMEMVIQYGFVNFFIMGFPLAPLFALLNNISELRVDASKMTKSYRRPVPVKVVGLGAWFGILQAMTYIGVVTNALVIAFTSNFMEKLIYTTLHKDYTPGGSLNQTLSIFDMNDFKMLDKEVDFSDTPICYYVGKRYHPTHSMKYVRRKDFWHHLAIKFGAVVIFEHIVIIIKGLLAYAIPDVPFSVKQQVVVEEKMRKLKDTRAKSQSYMKKREEMQRSVRERRASQK